MAAVGVILLICGVGIIAVYVWERRKRLLCGYGPRSYPVVGSLFSFWKNRGRLLEWYAEMLAESPTQTIVLERLGGVRTVVTANPANVEHMLRTRFENYPKGEPFTAILHDLLGRGIFNADGEAWRLQRRVASYEFNTRSLRSFVVQVVEEVTERLLPLLRDATERGRRPLDLQDVLQRFAFDNICRVAFGIDPASLDASLPVSEFARAFDAATELCARRATVPISLLWKVKRRLNVGSERRLAEAVRVVDDFAMDVIRRRRKEVDGGAKKHDLLSRFMAFANRPRLAAAMGAGHATCRSEEFLRDSIVSFILAGRDTTSAALTWLFWLLSTHPHVEDAIRLETQRVVAARAALAPNSPRDGPLVFSFEELQRMNYLHAAICESMRLYPPVPFDSKHALQNDVLPDGTFVAEGSRVTYHCYAMGRMESIWGPDCLQFKPERWLNEKGLYAPHNPFRFAVFQGGVRVCLGKEMAFIQMKYVVASVIANFRLRPIDCDRMPKCISSLTARMVGGFPVMVEANT